jgi:hypothetical protein
MEDIVLALIGVGINLLIFAVLVVKLFRIVSDGLVSRILRRLRRRPQFSLWTMLEITLVVAVGLSLYRGLFGSQIDQWIGQRSFSPVLYIVHYLTVGPITTCLAAGIVAWGHVVLAELWETCLFSAGSPTEIS